MEHIRKTFTSVIVSFMLSPPALLIVPSFSPLNAHEKEHFVISPANFTTGSARVIEGMKSGNTNPDFMAVDMEIESSNKELSNGKSKNTGCRT